MNQCQERSGSPERNCEHGQLSREDIQRELMRENGLVIRPHLAVCQKAASYDLTPTIIAMSAKTGYLQNVYRQANHVKDRYYIYVGKKDTVLIVSNEYIHIPPNIAGYVSSRVSKVVEGFGHISTTIDPNWSGAALIALSNPSNQPLKVFVGDMDGAGTPNPLATITLHYLATPCAPGDADEKHEGMRIDLLKRVAYYNRRGFWARVRKPFYRHRRNFTDYFFAAYEGRYQTDTLAKWEQFIEEFSYTDMSDSAQEPPSGGGNGSARVRKGASRKSQLRAKDFVITENLWIRAVHWVQRHPKGAAATLIALVLLILSLTGVLSNEYSQRISEVFFNVVPLF